MDVTGLRVALFGGNYNYVRDGANQALNRFVAYLLRQGAAVRVYSPTTDSPAFAPAGELVSAPSVPVPGPREYRIPYRMSGAVRREPTHRQSRVEGTRVSGRCGSGGCRSLKKK